MRQRACATCDGQMYRDPQREGRYFCVGCERAPSFCTCRDINAAAQTVLARSERIEAAVEALPRFHHPLSEDDEEGWMVGRDAVLAIIRRAALEPEEPPHGS